MVDSGIKFDFQGQGYIGMFLMDFSYKIMYIRKCLDFDWGFQF